jgi:hypothetical protein
MHEDAGSSILARGACLHSGKQSGSGRKLKGQRRRTYELAASLSSLSSRASSGVEISVGEVWFETDPNSV